jgi:hypothetical protein
MIICASCPYEKEESGMMDSVATRFGRLRQTLRPALFCLFLVLVGCASGGSNPFADATNVDVYLLRAESRNDFEVRVFINPGGRRQLVGTVPGNGLEFFEFRYPAGRALNIELESRMGDRYRIPATPFPGGGRVELLVFEDLRRSGYIRRSPASNLLAELP